MGRINFGNLPQYMSAGFEYQRRTGQLPPGWEYDEPSWFEKALPTLGALAGGAIGGPAGAAAGGTLGGLAGGQSFKPGGGPGSTMPVSGGYDVPYTNGGGGLPEQICSIIYPSRSGAGYNACMGIGQTLVPSGEGAEPGEACPTGYTKIGGTCVANRPGAYLPGGQPATVPTAGTALGGGWEAVQGSFGMPAMTPLAVQRTRYECPTGMVLGKDNLCYPRSTPGLGRRGSFRKWKGSPRPKVSAAEWKALQRAARTKMKVKEVAKEAGWKVSARGSRGR